MAMDDYDDIRAAFDRVRARSLELLERTEHAADVRVDDLSSTDLIEPRDDYDDPLVSWRRGMPQPEPERHERRAEREKLTDSEAQRWQNYIDGKIAKANAELDNKIAAAISARDKYWREIAKPGLLDAFANVINEVRDQLRGDFAAKVEQLDLRLSALLGDLSKRQSVLEAAERAAAERAAFQLPRGAQRFTHGNGLNGNA
jgi:hypothetical protein